MEQPWPRSRGCAKDTDMEKESHDEESSELEASVTTILDVLNTDCWRAVLDYLDIDDIVRSERVSRGWQQVVLQYLPGVKCYYHGRQQPRNKCYRRIKLEKVKKGDERRHIPMLEKMLKMLSPYFVKLFISTTDSWRIAGIKMTLELDELEDLTFYHIEPRFLENVEFKNCKRLKRLAFESCCLIRDNHLQKLITSNDIEELCINETHDISGEFMIDLQSNIKYLTLNKCWELTFENLVESYRLLSGLKKFEFNSNPLIVIDRMHIVLAMTPKVEWLSLNGYKSNWKRVAVGPNLINAIGRLTELKYFCMNYVTTDALLEAIASKCKALRSLHIEFSSVSGPAVVSLCRELPELCELNVAGCRHMTDEDLITCIACTTLTLLDASCCRVSNDLVAAVARDVRRRPRRFLLRLCKSVRDVDEASYEEEKRLGLKLSWRELEPE